jgi:hypothetical protein
MGQVPVVLKEKFQDRIGEVEVNLTFSPPSTKPMAMSAKRCGILTSNWKKALLPS